VLALFIVNSRFIQAIKIDFIHLSHWQMVAVSECSDDEKLSNENPSVDNFALIKLQFSHSGNRLLWHLDTQNQRGKSFHHFVFVLLELDLCPSVAATRGNT